jgi:hypothetical protein
MKEAMGNRSYQAKHFLGENKNLDLCSGWTVLGQMRMIKAFVL